MYLLLRQLTPDIERDRGFIRLEEGKFYAVENMVLGLSVPVLEFSHCDDPPVHLTHAFMELEGPHLVITGFLEKRGDSSWLRVALRMEPRPLSDE